MRSLVTLPILLPLLGAALSIGCRNHRLAQRAIGLTTLATTVATTACMLVRVDDGGPLVVQSGSWAAPVGITFVADRLASLLVAVAMVTLLAGLVYAIGDRGVERDHGAFHPTYLVLAAGIAASLLTGDLFNLFVAFEITLMASYVLITLGGGRAQVRHGTTYVVISLLASTLFLLMLALVYAATGTVNMADLSTKVADLPVGLRSALVVLTIVVFGTKAAIFPLFAWLPDSYPAAPTPVTAVFAGLLTKVGVYALLRTQTLMFPPDSRPGTLLIVIAGLTMVVGVLGAVAQTRIKALLSFHIVSQIGYIVMGLGLFTVAGIAGAIYFTIHQMFVKTSLLLVGGLVEKRTGTDDLARVSGLARRLPGIAALFLVAGLSLAGIPPLSGFIGKLALVEAGLDAKQYAIVGVSLAVSLLTLFSMTKIWSNAFWGPPCEGPELSAPVPGWTSMVTATTALVAGSLALALFGGPIYDLCARAAADVLDQQRYRTAVLGS